MMIHLVRPPSRASRRAQRLLARTGRGPLARAWKVTYLLSARVVGRYLAGGTGGASVYLRGSVGTSDLIPFVSDVDLVVLLEDERTSTADVHRRWERLERTLPPLAQLVDRPRVHRVHELGRLLGRSSYTVGLGGRSTAVEPAADNRYDRLDRQRLLERPGLYDTTRGWRLVAGQERRPPEPQRSAGGHHLAAWLELVFYWKRAFGAIADPTAPHTAALCVKLVSEATRIALWLEEGTRAESRVEALEHTARMLPDETSAVERLAELQTRLHRMPTPPVDLALPLFERLSIRIAGTLSRLVEPAGTTRVRLLRTDDDPGLPLCDWRALVLPHELELSVSFEAGTPGSAAAVQRALEREARGDSVALAADGILVFPSARRERAAMRAVASPLTDPVSFALLAGSEEAAFADVEGWSVAHWSQRAVAEHRHALAQGATDLATLAGAARAAILRETVAENEPVLPVTRRTALLLLAERSPSIRDAAHRAIDAMRRRQALDAGTHAALRQAVAGLRAFSATATTR